jgi:hypothetical protein
MNDSLARVPLPGNESALVSVGIQERAASRENCAN